MAEFIVMPKMGLTMTEGVLVKWKKSEGDTINKGDALFEVETDKLTNDYESTTSGVLRKIIVKEGTVKVLEPVGIIGAAGEDITELLNKTGASTAVEDVKKLQNNGGKNEGRVKISPKAKKAALELNIDYSSVKGTGAGGAITEEDIKNFAQQHKKKVTPTAEKVAEEIEVDLSKIEKDSRIMKADVIKFKLDENLTKYASPQETRIPMTTMRKVIAKRMTESVQISPTVTFNIKVDTTSMKRIKDDLKDIMKISYTDILVKVTSRVLLEFPLLNSSLDGNDIVTRNFVNMGVAVALPEGLLVPVVKYANVKGLKDISEEIKDMAQRAKANALTPDELRGGTFTITNIGMYGIDSFSPIINQPEVAILGVNAINEEPKMIDGEIRMIPMMNLSLTADHRVVDGAVAAQFLAELKAHIEKPGLLLM